MIGKGCKAIHLLLNHPAPPATTHSLRRYPYVFFQYVVRGRLPLQFAAPTGELSEHTLGPGELFYSVPDGWDIRRHDTGRRLLGIGIMQEHVRYVITDRRAGTPIGSGVRERYHTSAPLSGDAALVVQALNTCARRGGDPDAARQLFETVLFFVRKALAEDVPSRRGKAHATWQLVREYVDEYFHLPIDRSTVASEFGLAEDYISRLFRQEGQEGFNEYITRRRMQRALRLLEDGRYRVYEIAARCGYNSEGYFIKVFRRFHGTSPGKYGRG